MKSLRDYNAEDHYRLGRRCAVSKPDRQTRYAQMAALKAACERGQDRPPRSIFRAIQQHPRFGAKLRTLISKSFLVHNSSFKDTYFASCDTPKSVSFLHDEIA